MIFSLEGTITYQAHHTIGVEVGHIGYRVRVGETLNKKWSLGDTVKLFTYQYVREDTVELYGFPTVEALEFFELLLSVSGVGPKHALAIIDSAPLTLLKDAIAKGDASRFTVVSGIGRKTSERIIVDLKGKIDLMPRHDGGFSISPNSFEEVFMALEKLGYSKEEARTALREVPKDAHDTEVILRSALKALSR
ncbi:MAG: Holliday junction branch migration protein RuvA [Parcubacteria group bacterium]|nr:Holliday junction branch migration protein RuvA [Parcubacteria group bacterium]